MKVVAVVYQDDAGPGVFGQTVVDSGARGVANAKGFYSYTPAQAKRWEKRFLAFSYDIHALALKYRARPEDAK